MGYYGINFGLSNGRKKHHMRPLKDLIKWCKRRLFSPRASRSISLKVVVVVVVVVLVTHYKSVNIRTMKSYRWLILYAH